MVTTVILNNLRLSQSPVYRQRLNPKAHSSTWSANLSYLTIMPPSVHLSLLNVCFFFTFQDLTGQLHIDKDIGWSFEERSGARSHYITLYKGGGDAQSVVRSLDKAAHSRCSRWMRTFVKGTFSIAGPANSLLLSVGRHLHAFTALLLSFSSSSPFSFTFWHVIQYSSKTCRMLPLAWSRAEPAGYINNSWGWGFRRCHTSHGSGSPSVRKDRETNTAL